MPFASPADLSPIPQAEAPRDCPLCPRLVRFRNECRAEFPHWWNAPVPAFGDTRRDVRGYMFWGRSEAEELALSPSRELTDKNPVLRALSPF